MSVRLWGRLAKFAGIASLALTLLASSAHAATYRFDNFGGDGTWENGQNWVTASTHGTLPGTADVAEISSS